MRHTLWTGISETNVNIITSATRPHAFNNNNNTYFHQATNNASREKGSVGLYIENTKLLYPDTAMFKWQ